MDRSRLFLAFFLMAVVAIAPSLLWPPKRTAGRPGGQTPDTVAAPAMRDTVTLAPQLGPSGRPGVRAALAEDTIWIHTPLYRLGFSTLGARLVAVQLHDYESLAPRDSGQPVQLVPPDRPFLRHALTAAGGGRDTIPLDEWTFRPSADSLRVAGGGTGASVSFEAEAPGGGSRVTIAYHFVPEEYRFAVRGDIEGLGASGAVLLVRLADGLRTVESDSTDDYRQFAIVTKASKTERTNFSSLDPGERTVLDGPFEWVGVKSKYFLTAALAIAEGAPQFGGAIAVGGPRSGKAASRTAVTLTLPVPPGGDFQYQVFAGPLEYRQLARVGHSLDDANPYGWIFRPIIQPVSVFVVNILLWMHGQLNLAYGWVLILFGVIVRLLLWPLNQKAMEAGIRMQAVQPLIKEVQDRYRNDPERLQREMLRLYKEHKVNPFGGCLPMLLPMPVLLALFFVFANTIEFRGVPFLWLPDLSRADPYYIIPLLMGLSMFTLSKVGQIGVPPNPQAKMMLYFMPIFMTVLFLNFASGLNLYYAAQNIFSIPQQYLIAQRRLREAPVAKSTTPAPRPPSPRRGEGVRG
ncbi:MAG: membrane protein insertase YidC [Gemmatimonadales bacterium]